MFTLYAWKCGLFDHVSGFVYGISWSLVEVSTTYPTQINFSPLHLESLIRECTFNSYDISKLNLKKKTFWSISSDLSEFLNLLLAHYTQVTLKH